MQLNFHENAMKNLLYTEVCKQRGIGEKSFINEKKKIVDHIGIAKQFPDQMHELYTYT